MSTLLFYLTLPLQTVALTAFLLHSLSSLWPPAAFYSRAILSFSCLVFCACYGVFASVALRIVGYGGLSQYTVARAFKWTMWLTTGVEFVLQDEEHLATRPAVFIGNHQTYADNPGRALMILG
jgi:lysophosphatidate acyltransferase